MNMLKSRLYELELQKRKEKEKDPSLIFYFLWSNVCIRKFYQKQKKLDNAIALAIGIGINLMSVPRLEKLSQVTTEPGSIFNESGVEIDPVEFCKSIANHYPFSRKPISRNGIFQNSRDLDETSCKCWQGNRGSHTGH